MSVTVSSVSDRSSSGSAVRREPLPARGFKEWSLVCAALGAGAQSLILRKGGIHEGRGGFWWRHDRFFLFPTHFHEQEDQFRWRAGDPAETRETNPERDGHEIRLFAEVDFKAQITSLEAVEALAPLHFWKPEVVRQRFDYTDQAGISLAFLRVFRLNRSWRFPDERRFGGCRSWLDLPEPPEDLELTPVLDDAEHARRREALLALLPPSVSLAEGG